MSEEAKDSAVEPTPAVASEPDQPQAPALDAGQPEPTLPVEPEIPTWIRILDEAPADDLRAHPKFKGILGSELEARRERWEADRAEKDRLAA